MDDPDLELLEIRLLLDGIYERYGYDFRDYAEDSIRRRARVALTKSGAPNFGELQHRVLANPEALADLLGNLTVQVSDMFREPEQYAAFRRAVVPVLRTYPQLKLWHAGCASGEEAYSTAIVLEEEGLSERSLLYATDISHEALNRARDGVYEQHRLPRFEEHYRRAAGSLGFDRHCAVAYGRVVMLESLRSNMAFFHHNLVTDHALGEMQVIFCRNVVMYFTPKLAERVLEMLTRALCVGGFLCLGANEHLPARFRSLYEEFVPGQRIFRFRGERGRT